MRALAARTVKLAAGSVCWRADAALARLGRVARSVLGTCAAPRRQPAMLVDLDCDLYESSMEAFDFLVANGELHVGCSVLRSLA